MKRKSGFHNGDYIMGNKLADRYYPTTGTGCICQIVNACPTMGNGATYVHEHPGAVVKMLFHPSDKKHANTWNRLIVYRSFIGFRKITREEAMAYLLQAIIMKQKFKVGDYLIGAGKANKYPTTSIGSICQITCIERKDEYNHNSYYNGKLAASVKLIYHPDKAEMPNLDDVYLPVYRSFRGFKKISKAKAMAYLL